MSTNKVALRSVEQFMTGYTPVYRPMYPLFLGGATVYAEQVGELSFKRVDALSDIRAKRVTPKDTELQLVSVRESSKTFKKYFLANKFVYSNLQDAQGLQDVPAQVLDEHQKQWDELLLGDSVNSGLYTSSDSNYTLKSSATVAAGSAADHLVDLQTKIMATKAEAEALAGEKALIVYGTTALSKLDSVYASAPVAFRTVLEQTLQGISVVRMPSAITPANVNGWIMVNMSQIKVHHCGLPKLAGSGVNEEHLYAWFNFMMGSSMVEVLAAGGIIRQPVTFA